MSEHAEYLLLLALFALLFALRYTRTVVSIVTFISYQPKQIKDKSSFYSDDVTVVIPTTFKAPGELIKNIRSILNCSPAIVLLVTAKANVDLVKSCCALNSFSNVRVIGVDKLNKRHQMIRALKEVHTDIVVFADDNVLWPDNYLDYLLAIFEDPTVVAGGTRQRVRRESHPSFWNFLGIAYLERRVWNNVTTNAIDGSISTLSGRTAAYRTKILKCSEFYKYFTTDKWLGRPLNSDDDKCLTRYVYSRGWGIALQFDPRAIIETTVEDGPKYLAQCLRWARAHWRGNFTVMTNESYWRSTKYWWGCYVVFIGQFQSPALLVDGGLFYLLIRLVNSSPATAAFAKCHASDYAYALFAFWVVFTKIVKLIPHFYQYPQDLRFLPVSIAFSYLHGFLSIYALCTLTTTVWGSQELATLERARAENDEVVPLLRVAIAESDAYQEPTPGRIMEGADYFSVRPVGSGAAVRVQA